MVMLKVQYRTKLNSHMKNILLKSCPCLLFLCYVAFTEGGFIVLLTQDTGDCKVFPCRQVSSKSIFFL